VAYIAVINTKHFELSKSALDHGKHVLCEKPMCLTAKETKELVEHAKTRNLFLMEVGQPVIYADIKRTSSKASTNPFFGNMYIPDKT
jgi:predicted dehydrogenase